MIKRRGFFLCAALMFALLFTGCSHSNPDDGRVSVVTTNFALYDFARAVCGDRADVIMLISPGSESHDFEATLADIAKIASADLLISVGSEDWVEDVFTAIGAEGEDVNRISALENCELHGASCELPGHDHEHEHHDHKGEEIDEHVWTSIPNAVLLIEKIGTEMMRIDPENGEWYRARMQSYTGELTALDAQYREMIANAARQTIVVADRFPFLYMAEEYGLQWHGAFSGCSSDTEPALSIIHDLIETVQREKIPAVFIIEFSDGRTAGAVASETGCGILTLQSAHNVTRKEFREGITYLELMRENLEALKMALN